MKWIGLILSTLIIVSSQAGAFSIWPVNFTRGDVDDPYYQMESQNLNTMNSYFVPSDITPMDEKWSVNLADYVTESYDTQSPTTILTNTDDRLNAPAVLHFMSSYIGVWMELLVFLIVWYVIRYKPDSSFAQAVMLWFDMLYDFFEDILGDVPLWIKKFVVTLFSVIFVANLMWWLNDILRFFFPYLLRNFTAPSGELEFTIALALIATAAILYTQAKAVGWWFKLLHEYIPVTWKWLMPDNKIADIGISLFVWLLDIIGVFARIISLSLRLFGNMSAWSILLNVAFLWLGAVTVGLLSTNIAIGIPVIIYVQGVLSVLIQAFVFSLIVAIGLKMAHEW